MTLPFFTAESVTAGSILMRPVLFIQNTVSLEFSTRTLRQHRVGAAVRDPHEVAMVVGLGVRRDALVEALVFLLGARHERLDLARIVEGEAQDAAAPVGVAAAHFARGFFEDEHALGAVLPRRDRSRERGVARAHDDDVVLFHFPFPVRGPRQVRSRRTGSCVRLS